MAHARRKFHDLFVARRNEVNTEALRRIGELYAIEAAIRGKPPDERRRVRQEQARPLQTARAAGLTPVLEEPGPVCPSVTTALGDYVAQTDAVAAQFNVPLIAQYDYIQSLPNWQSMLSDCIHPTPALYEIKAQREAEVLGPLVKLAT